MKNIVTILFLIFTAKSIHSQNLDNSFGANGFVNYSVSQIKSEETLKNVEVQSDGKFIFLTTDFLSRYDAFDNLDTTFGKCGVVEVSSGNTMVLQNNGKIVVCIGSKTIKRYNSDGSIDSGFGTNGVIALPITNNIVINQIIETLDNKLVLGGAIHNGTKSDFLLIRLNTNGTLDSTFDLDGISQYSIGTIQDIGATIAIQADNKIVFTGKSKISSTNDDFATIRVNNTGALDISFGTNGIVLTEFSTNSNDYPSSIFVDVDGKILIAGISNSKLAIVKYNINGSLDVNFNNGKFLDTSTTNLQLSLSSTTLTSSGGVNLNLSIKVIIKSIASNLFITCRNATTQKYRICKITQNNSTSFTTSSTEYSPITTTNSNYFIYSNNSLLTGGYSTVSNVSSIIKLKYDTNLQFQSLSTINTKQGTDHGVKLYKNSDNSIIISSINNNVYFNNYWDPYYFSKINGLGILETNFSNSTMSSIGILLSKDNNDKYYILDNVNFTKIYRYDRAGLIDLTFGINGILDLTNYQNGSITFIHDLKVDNYGNIYFAFDFDNNISNGIGNDSSFGLIKTNYLGSIDNNFGVNSILSCRFNINSSNDREWPLEINIDQNNKICVLGITTTTGSYSTLILRTDSNGNLDNTFGTNGKIIFLNKFFLGLITHNNYYYFKDFYRKIIMCLDFQGNLNNSFGTNGLLSLNQLDESNDFIIRPCDGIYVGGSKNYHFSITKYNFNGIIDTSFGTTGTFTSSINCYSKIKSLELTSNNTITALGYSWNGNVDKITLMRINGLPNNPTALPIASTNQIFNSGGTLQSLLATGTNLQWYTNITDGVLLSLNTPLVSGTTYYVSQTVNGCEGPRLGVTVQVQLAIADFNTIKISYSPNPVTNFLDVKSNEILKSASIMNALGQIVYFKNFNNTELQLDLANLSAGSYFVKVQSDEKQSVFKIVKE